jgi:hypothetical protein
LEGPETLDSLLAHFIYFSARWSLDDIFMSRLWTINSPPIPKHSGKAWKNSSSAPFPVSCCFLGLNNLASDFSLLAGDLYLRDGELPFHNVNRMRTVA